MKKSIEQRLEALERYQEAAERKAFASSARYVLVAYYVGALRPHENLMEAMGRALQYESFDDFLADAMQGLMGQLPDNRERFARAYRQLLQKFGYELPATETEFEDAIIEMAEQLPQRWQKWIRSTL